MTKPTTIALLVGLLAACKTREDKPPPPVETAPPVTRDGPAAAARPLPPGRTPVPSISEYSEAREVTVKGSSALKCETKMVREWLRVTCRGRNDTGGIPTSVSVTRGGRGETIVYAGGGVTSVITPVLEGADFEARFSWSDKSHPLLVRWPKGAPKPVVVGEFQGAASPLDGTAPSAVICDCHKKVTGEKDCAQAPMAHADCERTYAGECRRMLACAAGDPSFAPECPKGKRNAGATGWCATICGAGGKGACGGGTECTREWGEPPVCM